MNRHPEDARLKGKGELINMAQYDPLKDYLSEYKGNELTLTFKEIDNIIREAGHSLGHLQSARVRS